MSRYQYCELYIFMPDTKDLSNEIFRSTVIDELINKLELDIEDIKIDCRKNIVIILAFQLGPRLKLADKLTYYYPDFIFFERCGGESGWMREQLIKNDYAVQYNKIIAEDFINIENKNYNDMNKYFIKNCLGV